MGWQELVESGFPIFISDYAKLAVALSFRDRKTGSEISSDEDWHKVYDLCLKLEIMDHEARGKETSVEANLPDMSIVSIPTDKDHTLEFAGVGKKVVDLFGFDLSGFDLFFCEYIDKNAREIRIWANYCGYLFKAVDYLHLMEGLKCNSDKIDMITQEVLARYNCYTRSFRIGGMMLSPTEVSLILKLIQGQSGCFPNGLPPQFEELWLDGRREMVDETQLREKDEALAIVKMLGDMVSAHSCLKNLVFSGWLLSPIIIREFAAKLAQGCNLQRLYLSGPIREESVKALTEALLSPNCQTAVYLIGLNQPKYVGELLGATACCELRQGMESFPMPQQKGEGHLTPDENRFSIAVANVKSCYQDILTAVACDWQDVPLEVLRCVIRPFLLLDPDDMRKFYSTDLSSSSSSSLPTSSLLPEHSRFFGQSQQSSDRHPPDDYNSPAEVYGRALNAGKF